MYTKAVRFVITYAATVCWPMFKCRTCQAKLNELQMLASVGVSGTGCSWGCPGTPSSSLDDGHWSAGWKLQTEFQWTAEAEIITVRAYEQSMGIMREHMLQMGLTKWYRDMHSINYSQSCYLVGDSEREIIPMGKDGIIWYTDGSKSNEVAGAGVQSHGIRRRFSFNVGHYTAVFQTEVSH